MSEQEKADRIAEKLSKATQLPIRVDPETGQMSINRCTCWVANESEESRFGIRYGAHCPNCSEFRVSGDPVDRANDEELHSRR